MLKNDDCRLIDIRIEVEKRYLQLWMVLYVLRDGFAHVAGHKLNKSLATLVVENLHHLVNRNALVSSSFDEPFPWLLVGS